MTTVVFAAAAVYALRERDRARLQAALFLFLECVSLGLFVSADLIVFFVFFDLSIVGMYFSIAGWGHGERARSAMKFFLYTFLGSLALLAGFIGLYVASRPHTFDMVELTRHPVSGAGPLGGGLVLGAILLGLAVKTPTFPFHTWLPPAHTDAPAIGSAVLAGVLLKMGTYGFVRIAMPMLPGAWRAWAPVIITVGVISVLYGALVALAQRDLKRMVAYTSVNHMGYVVVAVGVAGVIFQRLRAGAGRRGHRSRHPDGQPRADHRGAVPARRGDARPRRQLRHGGVRRTGGDRTALRRPVRGGRLRVPGAARVLRLHRRVPGLHRQHRGRCRSPPSPCLGSW